MRWRSPVISRNGRALGISLLILSLVHTPLPQPDFHNIRHHDDAGQVCEYHDHLLRWHPGAGVASDVAVLHWHWFLPAEPGVAPPGPEGMGPAVHAHSPAWLTATWDDSPQVMPETLTRPAFLLTLVSPDLAPGFLFLPPPGPLPGPRSPSASGAPFAPGVSLISLLQRWVC